MRNKLLCWLKKLIRGFRVVRKCLQGIKKAVHTPSLIYSFYINLTHTHTHARRPEINLFQTRASGVFLESMN